jgi:AraC-like DNA-binding protein
MQALTDPDAFRSAPRGHYFVGPTWLVWCWDESLCGSIVWGRPSEDEARQLVSLFAIEAGLQPGFDVVTDASRMELVTPLAFAVVADYIRRQLPMLGKHMRKNAIVSPPGLIGAAIAGLYPLLGANLSWRPVTTMQQGLEWIDSPAARAAAPELAALADALCGRSSLLFGLHTYLRAHLGDATLDGAATALRSSRRSLQRSLTNSDTCFRDELERVRIDEARRLLAESDDKLEAIAAQLGFSSPSHFGTAFRTATGELPSEFRARYRSPSDS